jgi:methylenetetrahydrofolate dehydrogenase (NADP+)/methenyltetrahydrofolate cyclohydrolase
MRKRVRRNLDMAVLMDGKALAAKVKAQVAEQTANLDRKPGLAVVVVGDNPASRVYVNGKKKDCAECGFFSEERHLPEDTTQEELLAQVAELNGRADIDGILVQLPLPKQLNEREVLMAIAPQKDVDCFHPYNIGKLMIGESAFLPCTPAGVMKLLEEYGIDPEGKHCVMVGRSNIVGKPQALLMLHRGATVTICHSKTRNLAEECRRADILVSAVGKVGLITADMVKEGAVVIDVAMNRNEEGKLCGDVDFDAVAEKASYITPVPGGVGPMTRAMLMVNTLNSYFLERK